MPKWKGTFNVALSLVLSHHTCCVMLLTPLNHNELKKKDKQTKLGFG